MGHWATAENENRCRFKLQDQTTEKWLTRGSPHLQRSSLQSNVHLGWGSNCLQVEEKVPEGQNVRMSKVKSKQRAGWNSWQR